MKHIHILIPLLGLLFTACDNDGLSQQQEIRVGEAKMFAGNLLIGFDAVENESRCPENALCAWEGVAIIRLMVNGQIIRTSTLEGWDPSSEFVVNGRTIKVISLTPDPPRDVGNEENLPQEDYRVVVAVE